MRHGVQSLRESWCRAECAPGRTQDERGPPKTMAVASFCAPDIGRTPFRVSQTMATLQSIPKRAMALPDCVGFSLATLPPAFGIYQ